MPTWSISGSIALVLGKTGRTTRFGANIGTPDYMSPEADSGRDNCDDRTDVYSFGCGAVRDTVWLDAGSGYDRLYHPTVISD